MPSVIPSEYVYWDRFGYVRESDKTGPYTISSSGDAALIGNGSALDLNFLSGTLDPRITFTRASSATFIGSNGLIQTAASGVPRFEYDPVTLAPKGMLIEEARTNVPLNSTIDGANLATQSVTVTAQAYTLSFYGTGTVTLSGASTAGPLVGSGAYPTRSTLTFTPSAGSLTLTVTGTVQFTNLEAGTFATSFIPTAGAAATRGGDSQVMPVSSFYSPGPGTLLCEFARNGFSSGGSPAYMTTGAGYIGFQNGFGTPTQQRFDVANAGAAQAQLPRVGTATAGTIYRQAGAWAENDFAHVSNAATPVTDSLGTVPDLTGATMVIAEARMNGHIRRIRYWPKRLPNATLQALTA